MSAPVTPVNFQAFSAQALTQLTWIPSLGATSYIINRTTGSSTPATITLTGSTHSTTTVDTLSINPITAGVVVGDTISGAGISANTTVSAVTATTITLSQTATATASGVTLTINFAITSNTQFLDTRAVVGVVYNYNVEATDGTTPSSPTATLQALSLIPGQTTAGNLMLESQQRTNKEYSNFYTQQEWISMISQSYKELYDLILDAYGNDYFVQIPYTYTTTGQIDPITQAQTFPLPPDFYKLLRCEVALNPSDPNSWITLRQFMAVQRNLYNYPNIYTFYGITNLKYRLWGSNLELVPIAAAGQTIRIWYAPKPNQLINLTDTIDGISGWEEYIVADVCTKALVKEESFEQASAFGMQKAALMKRIDEIKQNRNIGEPQLVSDSKLRNFSWSDSAEGSYGGGGYGY